MEATVKEKAPGVEAAPGVVWLRTLIANVCLVGEAGSRRWTLVDGGVEGSAGLIRDAAEEHYGEGAEPEAIILTHGHFDHVGALDELGWAAPIYAHELELPYLTGESDYPPADPSTDPGLLARLSPLYPHRAVNLGDRVRALPSDGTVPSLSDWRWLHTPGHTPGHIVLFRESDRVLLAGDAFTTVKQESALAVLTQHQEVHGPPKYFTTDWLAARDSVIRLEALAPQVAVTGHGTPMRGAELARGLERLAREFAQLAAPEEGRFLT